MSGSRTIGSFAEVLGTSRGSQRHADPEPKVLTLRERIRAFFAWMNHDDYELRADRVAYLRAERRKAAELNLHIHHGAWEADGDDCSETLTFIYDEDTARRAAVIEMTNPGDGRLFLEDT